MNRETKEKSMPLRLLCYFGGLLIMTMGIAISVKSNLGVSPVSSIPYTMTCIWGIEMGRATILFHAALVLMQIAVLRKDFKWKNLLQVAIGVVFGYFTTFCNHLMTFFPAVDNLWIRLAMMWISTLLIAIGLYLYVPANFVPLAGEGAMLAIAQVTKIPFSTVKIIFDSSMVAISLVTCLLCIHSLGSVGIGTVVAAVLVGVQLKLIQRICGRK